MSSQRERRKLPRTVRILFPNLVLIHGFRTRRIINLALRVGPLTAATLSARHFPRIPPRSHGRCIIYVFLWRPNDATHSAISGSLCSNESTRHCAQFVCVAESVNLGLSYPRLLGSRLGENARMRVLPTEAYVALLSTEQIDVKEQDRLEVLISSRDGGPAFAPTRTKHKGANVFSSRPDDQTPQPPKEERAEETISHNQGRRRPKEVTECFLSFSLRCEIFFSEEERAYFKLRVGNFALAPTPEHHPSTGTRAKTLHIPSRGNARETAQSI